MHRASLSYVTRLVVFGLSMAVLAAGRPARADVKLPRIFGSHMVLQQGQKDRVWGTAAPGEPVSVTIDYQSKSTTAGNDGKWTVTLDPMMVGGPHTMTVKGRNNTVTFDDVLIGEVWLCSGQSNMQWAVQQANDGDLESRTAKYPKIRLITVPNVGTQEPQDDFRGQWEPCTPQTVKEFSAVGYFFGRQLHQTLGVPIGLIDDAWGGSACEAWIRRDLLAADEAYKPLMERWEKMEKDAESTRADFQKRLDEWKSAAEKARSEGTPEPRRPQPRPNDPMTGNARPANIYNGALKPTIGYGLRGAIWYQGETNASRAYQYRDMFPLMIKSWRDEWKIGDFPFYWVQLADFRPEKPEPAESDWAELREAQTLTMSKLPNTGEAVIIDLGEDKDIHPRNKQDVAKRLARWALARDYGIELPYHSPAFKSMERNENKVTLTFDHVGGGPGLLTLDTRDPAGFAVAGNDHKFRSAKARQVGRDKIEVWSEEVSEPVAVRYAWADNPVCNVYSREGLPLTPFRTDDWPGVTANNK
jgi:sialate O-acetylesterase